MRKNGFDSQRFSDELRKTIENGSPEKYAFYQRKILPLKISEYLLSGFLIGFLSFAFISEILSQLLFSVFKNHKGAPQASDLKFLQNCVYFVFAIACIVIAVLSVGLLRKIKIKVAGKGGSLTVLADRALPKYRARLKEAAHYGCNSFDFSLYKKYCLPFIIPVIVMSLAATVAVFAFYVPNRPVAQFDNSVELSDYVLIHVVLPLSVAVGCMFSTLGAANIPLDAYGLLKEYTCPNCDTVNSVCGTGRRDIDSKDGERKIRSTRGGISHVGSATVDGKNVSVYEHTRGTDYYETGRYETEYEYVKCANCGYENRQCVSSKFRKTGEKSRPNDR